MRRIKKTNQNSWNGIVRARMMPDHPAYCVALSVSLPPIVLPMVKPTFFIDDTFDRADVERLLRESARIHAASNAIVNEVLYGWRMPTADEMRRLDELAVEHDVAVAMLERTRVTPN